MSGTELTEEQTQLLSTMNGYEKAAVLMLSLNEEDAAGIFRHLEPKQVQRLGMTMASMSDFSHDKVTAVHRCFINDIQKHSSIGLDASGFIKDVLVQALGEDKASNLVEQIIMGSGSHGLDSLKWMDARQVATIIQHEHPQIQTIVLSYLDPEQSAEILSQFPEPVRLDLILRIADLEEVQPAALQELNEIMEKQFAGSAGAQAAKMGGLKAAASIMNYLDTNLLIWMTAVCSHCCVKFPVNCSRKLLKAVMMPSRRNSSRICPSVQLKCSRRILKLWVLSASAMWRQHRRKFLQLPDVLPMPVNLYSAAVAATASYN